MDEYMQKITLGKLEVHNDKIVMCDYDENWPVIFKNESDKIHKALNEIALGVEHVGSTSVPGLCAKPIIDILLLVEDSVKENRYVKQLENIGYVLKIRETNFYEHRLFKKQKPNINLHVLSKGSQEAEKMILFRNWLRNHDEDRVLYEKTKRELSNITWKYVQEYADAKTDIISEILNRVHEE